MSIFMWGLLAAAILGLFMIKRTRHVAPDRVVVRFTDNRRNQVLSWQRGGLVVTWPWQHTGELPMQAMTISLNVAEPPLCLVEGEHLRFVFGIGENDLDIAKAAVAFADKKPEEIISLVQGIIVRHFEGLQVTAIRVDRTYFENNLVQNIRESLRALGMSLLSFNLDGIFGDAPEVKYCVAEEDFGG